MGKVWFITGASRGFGRAYAEEAVAHGDYVVAAMRTVRTDDAFLNDEHVLPVSMDVTDERQITDAVQAAVDKFGRIDVLVNNAGFGFFGAFEETSDAELRAVMETNVFGVAGVTRAVIPIMRRQGSGRIINIASRSGMIGEAGCTLYNAAKFAIVGLSEGLAEELGDFGIQVMAACPGSFRTDFRDVSSKKEPKNLMSEYEGKLGHRALVGTREGNHKQVGDPKKAAKLIYEAANWEHMPVKLMIGEDCCHDVTIKLAHDIEEIQSYYSRSADTKIDD